MSMLTRSITLGVLALGVGATALAAQQKPRGYSNYRWYIGGQGSYFNFQTTGQTRGWIPSVGGNTMIIAKRTGLLVSVDDALGSNEVATIAYAGSATGTQQVAFNDVLRFSFHLMAFPWRGIVEPYIGVGGGIMYAVSPAGAEHGGLHAGRAVDPLRDGRRPDQHRLRVAGGWPPDQGRPVHDLRPVPDQHGSVAGQRLRRQHPDGERRPAAPARQLAGLQPGEQIGREGVA